MKDFELTGPNLQLRNLCPILIRSDREDISM